MLSQKKRRRKRKKSSIVISSSTQSQNKPLKTHSNPASSSVPATSIPVPKPRLTKAFINEEIEVQNAIIAQSKKKTQISDQSSKNIDNEISFFIDHIFVPDFDTIPTIIVDPENINTPTSGKTNDRDAQQLASSYIQIDDESVVQKWTKELINFNDTDLLYYPTNRISPKNIEIKEDEESPVSKLNHFRKLSEDGLFVHEIPRISNKNKNLLINRFIMEGLADKWLNFRITDNTVEILELKKFSQDLNLYRSKSEKTFTPIEYLRSNATEENNLLPSTFNDRILRVHISEVNFYTHPSFTKEYTYAKRLEFLYRQYHERLNDKIIDKLENRLQSIRHLLEADTIPEDEQDDSKLTSNKRNQLLNDLRDTRNQLHREGKFDRELLQSLLEQWKALKELRKKQGFNKTSIRIIIRTQDMDENVDRENWNHKFETEFNEILEETFDDCKNERSQSNISEPDEELNKKISKPDKTYIRDKLYQVYKESMRHPGESVVFIEMENLSIGNEYKMDSSEPSAMMVFQVMFDEQKVGSVKRDLSFGASGIVNVNAMFSIKLTRKVPNQISVNIFEEHRLKSKQKISEIMIPMPNHHDLFSNSPQSKIEFASIDSNITGQIRITIGWNSIDNQNSELRTNPNLATQKSRMLHRKHQMVQNWYNEHLLDPMDPEINSMIENLENDSQSNQDSTEKTTKKSAFYFNEDLTAFCTKEELNSNPRLNMLSARFRNELKINGNKAIPHSIREIEKIPNIYDDAGDNENDDYKMIEELGWMDPIDVQRHKGRKYLKNIYGIISNHVEKMSDCFDTQDLLIGDTPPTFSSFVSAVMQIFGPKRPLNPHRRTGKITRAVSKPTKVNNLKIIVNIIRATGIPIRSQENVVSSSAGRRSSEISSAISSQRANNILPYVSVSFRDKTARTTTAEGSNPTWNEQLIIPISGSLNVGEIKDTLCLHLFDEYIADLLDDDRSRDSEIYQRISSKWMGELRIPFTTIYANQRIEGTFEMTTPTLLLGYSKPSVASPSTSLFINNILETRSCTYLTVFISLEPIIDTPITSTTKLESTELIDTRNRIQFWYNEFKEEFPDRYQDPLVTLSNGKRICITRLIGPIDVPFQLSDAIEQLIRRFVAMIPVMQSTSFCSKLDGVWLTNDQIINILTASSKDLGILLSCYYTTLEYQCYLVFGHTLYHADTTYVLIKENDEYFLINPHTGKKYLSKDTLCPLIKVYCLVNGENVWANIQKENRVYLTQFDVTQSADWRPLFNKSCKAPIGLVHNVNFEYRNSDNVVDLQRIIELKLMKKINGWRSNRKTVWNRNLSEMLRQILMQLEEDTCFEFDNKIANDKLIGLSATYKLSGFPLNMPYINLSSIVERVKCTGIHLNIENKVEFSLAAHIQQYPNNVLSVWIFLISLVPKF